MRYNIEHTIEIDVQEAFDELPTTKEQRDLLFQKIEEAGYQWDAKKKELKLLISNGGDFESNNSKQKPTWSDEDEKITTALF